MSPDKSLLNEIPHSLLPDSIQSFKIVEGGMNNYNYLLNKTYLLKKYQKQDETNDPVYLRFIREKDSLIRLKKVGCVPILLNFLDNDPNLFIAREWIDGAPISLDILNSDDKLLKKLVGSLIQVHNHAFKTAGDFNYLDVIKRYLNEYKKMFEVSKPARSIVADMSWPAHNALFEYFSEHLEFLRDTGFDKLNARIHGDLVFSNIIVTRKEQKVMLIDWEYSTSASPYLDLAYLVTQNPMTKNIETKILEEYETQSSCTIEDKLFTLYKNLMNLMSGLWFSIYIFRSTATISNMSKQQLLQIQKTTKLAKDKFKQLKLI
ncbi:MAG: phosphotransferase [Candidatus Hodarchaeales archaeon]